MRFTRVFPLMLSLSLFALTGCEALFTAPKPNTGATGSQQQETKEVTDETKPTTTYMYVMNGLGKTLDEISLKTMAVTSGVMTTGLYPNQLLTLGVVTYLVNSGDNNVVKLDLRARKTLATINLDLGANPATLTPFDGGKAFVTNSVANNLVFLDLTTSATESTLASPQGSSPFFQPAVSGSKAYVPANKWAPDWSSLVFSGVHVVDLATKQVLKTIELEADADPSNASVDPSGKVWLGVKDGLIAIDPASDTKVHTLAFGVPVTHVQFVSATKGYGKVSGGLVSFNPSTGAILKDVAGKIEAEVDVMGAFKIFNGVGYVSNFGKDTVSVVDLVTETASGSPIPVGDGPQDLTFVTVED
jgi:DNA-binding beta-propeller fold protein YncE